MAVVTRLGLYGGTRSPYGDFSGKTPQEIIEVVETFSGGYFDYGTTRERFRPKTKPEKKAAPIIERIAEKIILTDEIETKKDIELILRLRLKKENIKYKKLYLTWITQKIAAEEKIKKKRKKRKQEDELIIMMMLH